MATESRRSLCPSRAKKLNRLVTVFSERGFDGLFHAGRQWTSTTQITCSLLRNANVAMTGARSAVHDFARSRDAETFFSTLVGLHFVGRHSSPRYLKSLGALWLQI